MDEDAWLGREPMLGHCDWHALITAADAAGRLAARGLACRCPVWELGHTGQVWVRVEPLLSPFATWLSHQGYAQSTEARTGVLVPIAVNPADLHPASAPGFKARSLLVRRAYAAAYCTVLAEEAGTAAMPVTDPDTALAGKSQRRLGHAPEPLRGG